MSRINVTRSSMPPYDEYCNEIKELWDTRWLTNSGRKHQELKEQLTNFLNVNYIELFTNGHMALEMSLQALQLKGEVITTPFTFVSTTNAIIRSGLQPVFCDINPQNYTIDAGKIEQLINRNTCAIMPVHVYGNICDVNQIQYIADKYGLKVIYDAAHAFAERYEGAGIGTFGDISCFSFHATKVFHCIEGGAACFKNIQLEKVLMELKDFGIADEENVEYIGANAKMNEFAAAMGLCNLRHIEAEIEKRRHVVERYRKNLENIDGLRLNEIQPEVVSNYAYFPIEIDESIFGYSRDMVKQKLADNDIMARKYFYPITSVFPCVGADKTKTPIALEVSNRILTLPLYADLETENVDKICDIIVSLRNK